LGCGNSSLDLFIEFTAFANSCDTAICHCQKGERINLLLLVYSRHTTLR
jgi:hypothetical protein